MLYRDLIHFEPLESVKQLRAAGGASQAVEDVQTFVISASMRENLVDVVFPQLRFDNPDVDHKGLLLIATYGTGKTHLMSCLSAVAEDVALAAKLTDADTAAAAETVAGKFKVVRVEIGATKMALRDIIARELTDGLAAHGVAFTFPSMDQVTNNKASLADMMAAFEAVHPDHGLLLVVDELLDYLRTRRDTEIILDLGVLREMGEFCRDSRFRLIAGVQETLFDNPRFNLAQDEIRRVRERYQQFRISRQDVAFVVQRRILGKTDEQKSQIRSHLTRFSEAFESLGQDLNTFVDLFPVHPAYLRTFENLTIVEKRRVLSSLSEQIRQRLDTAVPDTEPGLICSDSYRAELESDPSNKTIAEVKDVLDRTRTIRDRVERGLAVKTDVPPALRIVDALAIHRLTTDDVEAPIGLTYDELRDDLCLLPPGTPEFDPAFIASSIETLVDEILKAVSGQFLSVNPVNGQVYLDLKKTVDYEQQIEERAATLDDPDLDAGYYKALEQVLEVSGDPFRTGYRIWDYELPWADKKVTRSGYLFMGAPNERSTAKPQRDFYLYFLQPYAPPPFTDERKSDEVLLELDKPNAEFTQALRRYAAANAKAGETTAQHKPHFVSRRDKHLQEVVGWLKAHIRTNLLVTHAGVAKPFGQWLSSATGALRGIKEQVDAIAAHVLASHFQTRYPGYPAFAGHVTNANLGTTISAALAMLAGRETQMGRMALAALELLDVDNAVSDTGPYATHLAAALAAAGGQAVNAEQLFTTPDGPGGLRVWGPWHLEPELAVVVAASLAHLGRAELGFANGTKVGAHNLATLTQMGRDDLAQLSYVTTPAGADTAALRQVAQLVGVAPGIITLPLPNETVATLVTKAETVFGSVAAAKAYLQGTPRLWGEEIFDDPAARIARLDALAALLADVKGRNTPGKLARFAVTDTAVLAGAAEGRTELARVEQLRAIAGTLTDDLRYLENAGAVLGAGDPYVEEVGQGKVLLRDLLRAAKVDKAAAGRVRRAAEELKARYKAFAVERHTADRLDVPGDVVKVELTGSGVWQDLRQLSAVPLLPSGQFGHLETDVANLVTCKTFTPALFDAAFTCAACNYRPTPPTGPTAAARLAEVKARAPQLWQQWIDATRDVVVEDDVAAQVKFLPGEQQAAVADLVEGKVSHGSVSSTLVAAVSTLVDRFEVARVTPRELWDGLFLDGAAMTPAEAAVAFTNWLAQLAAAHGGDSSRIRIVPAQEQA